MKIRTLEFDGTPEEFSKVDHLFSGNSATAPALQPSPDAAEPAEELASAEFRVITPQLVIRLLTRRHLSSNMRKVLKTLLAAGNRKLTTTEIAHHLGVHPTTIKNWRRAGILNSHKANDKNERLYEPVTRRPPPHRTTR